MSVVSNHLPDPRKRDWHSQRTEEEPRCAADQWRTKDRSEVLFMSEMTDRHLGHCIRFASILQQHASRLGGLLAEKRSRSSK